MPASSRAGPSITTDDGLTCSAPLWYPTGGGLVITMVTPTDFNSNASTSTVTVVGGSINSIAGSLLTMVMGMAYVPTCVTLDQRALTVSAVVGLSDCRVSWSPPTRIATSSTGCTSTNWDGMALCGTGTVTSRVSGGLPA